MTDFEFYQMTKTLVEKMADLRGISTTELNKYYSHTDQYCHFYRDLSEIPQVFAQMVFHAQNASRISSIVKFERNYNFLKRITYGFSPEEFLNHYLDEDTRVSDLVNVLRWDAQTNPEGIKWDSEKSEKKDAIAKRLAQSMFNCAEYLRQFHSKQEVLDDLMVPNPSTRAVINNFKSKINTGFGIALACDFLKEFDVYFEFLAKPDLHIKGVIGKLKNKVYNETDKSNITLVNDVQEITGNINAELRRRGEREITVYQLDRMIWLVCSENFFIPGHPNGTMKQVYISKL